MSVNNIVRYPAKQGNFSATQTLVDVEIPSGSGVWNLSKCYIDIPVKPTYTETINHSKPVAFTIGAPTYTDILGWNVQCRTNSEGNTGATATAYAICSK